MFNVKTIITGFLLTIGAFTVFSLIRQFAPMWLWASIVGIGFIALLLLCAHEPKPKPKYWFCIIEYLDEAGRLCKQPYIKKGYDKPFFDKEDLQLIDRIVRFHFVEIDEETYFSIKEKSIEQEQKENKSKDLNP